MDEPTWAHRVLLELRTHGLINRAAREAKTTVKTISKYRESCVEFDDACQEAIEEATDDIELEARRRAVEGVERGVWHQGACVGYETQYSDSLMQSLLKAKRASQFGDKREITGPGGGPLTVLVRSFGSNPSDGQPITASMLDEVVDAEYRALPRMDTLDLQTLDAYDLV